MRRTCLFFLSLIVFLIPGSLALAETTLVSFGKATEWKYRDDGKVLAADWMQPAFVDADWAKGLSPLGYGDTGLNTRLHFGDDPENKQITTYFRRTFEVVDPAQFKTLVLLIRSDDGVVVYLNGKEVARNNLPAGEITAQTTALQAIGGVLERLYQRFTFSGETLVAGKNVLAVELHQANPRSSDLYLDLSLTGYQDPQELRPTITPLSKPAVEAYHRRHFVPPSVKIADGYVDGGRGMKLDDKGTARSRRELLLVDRSRDETLNEYLKFARSEEVKTLEPTQRALRLAKYIDGQTTFEKNNRFTLAAVMLLTQEYANEGVLIGEVNRLCGAGVCRHRALLFKILADEAGLDVALVRGNFGDENRREGHAWNELHLKDGRRFVVDVMHRRMIPITPETTAGTRRYLTVDNKPWYGEAEVELPVPAPRP